ncbi:hypothetical protein FG392_28565 [Klebsiella pneumoniae]|nr:hypothetical protein FG392_28565 [Klebsiella pneumoniae]HBZ1292672.1 hypothetical protein [Klebsiella pneumoniae]
MRLPCTKGECFLPVDRVTTGRSRPGKVSYALACFIFRFLRCPLKDRPVLMGAAAKRGYLLTLAEEERALEARDVLMSELAANDC